MLISLWNKLQFEYFINTKTVAELSNVLNSTKNKICIATYNNKKVIISKDINIIEHIMRKNPNNYIERMGNSVGLEHIRMKNAGIIWNNNNVDWKRQRKLFDFFTKGAQLESAVSSIGEVTTNFSKATFSQLSKEEYQPFNLLNYCRSQTFSY